jgi:hypothetical protein
MLWGLPFLARRAVASGAYARSLAGGGETKGASLRLRRTRSRHRGAAQPLAHAAARTCERPERACYAPAAAEGALLPAAAAATPTLPRGIGGPLTHRCGPLRKPQAASPPPLRRRWTWSRSRRLRRRLPSRSRRAAAPRPWLPPLPRPPWSSPPPATTTPSVSGRCARPGCSAPAPFPSHSPLPKGDERHLLPHAAVPGQPGEQA